MRFIPSCLVVASLSGAALAQQAVPDADHAAHHPAGASAPAAVAKKVAARPKAQVAAPASAASAGMGMSADMRKMHDEAHKPGGMHKQMHGKDAKTMMGGVMPAMPAASPASR